MTPFQLLTFFSLYPAQAFPSSLSTHHLSAVLIISSLFLCGSWISGSQRALLIPSALQCSVHSVFSHGSGLSLRLGLWDWGENTGLGLPLM